MTLQLHRPDAEGRLRPTGEPAADWRTGLRSARWGRATAAGRMPALDNPEMNPTSRFRSVLFWLVLAAITFGLLVAGYGSGFWH